MRRFEELGAACQLGHLASGWRRRWRLLGQWVGSWGCAVGISGVATALFLLVFVVIFSLFEDLGLAFWKRASLGFRAGCLNTLRPVRRRQDTLVLLLERALFALVMSREREQALLLSGS